MICPHCKKTITFEKRILYEEIKKMKKKIKEVRRNTILKVIKQEGHTLHSLSRELKIPITTLNHHLKVMEKEKLIYFEELKHIVGKPKLIKINNNGKRKN